jgi:hypothetical protein
MKLTTQMGLFVAFLTFFMGWMPSASIAQQAPPLSATLIQGTSIGAPADIANLKAWLTDVAEQAGLRAEIQVLKLDDPQLLDKIHAMPSHPDGVQWVSYHGHGYNDGSGWPAFNGKNGRDAVDMSMDAVESYMSQTCRLRITMYECCTVGQTTRNHPDDRPDNISPAPEVCKLLFRKGKGTVRMCAAAATKYAYTAKDYGGFFTNSLLESAETASVLATRTPADAWNALAKAAYKSTNEKDAHYHYAAQNPQFKINITTVGVGTTVTPRAILPSLPPDASNINNTPGESSGKKAPMYKGNK